MRRVVDRCAHGLTAAFCTRCREHRGTQDRASRAAWARQEDELELDRPDDRAVLAKYPGRCAASERCSLAEGDWIIWVEAWDGWCCLVHAGEEEEVVGG